MAAAVGTDLGSASVGGPGNRTILPMRPSPTWVRLLGHRDRFDNRALPSPPFERPRTSVNTRTDTVRRLAPFDPLAALPTEGIGVSVQTTMPRLESCEMRPRAPIQSTIRSSNLHLFRPQQGFGHPAPSTGTRGMPTPTCGTPRLSSATRILQPVFQSGCLPSAQMTRDHPNLGRDRTLIQ